MPATKSHKVAEMTSEYRFDYSKAKPNRFANKMNLNVGWTVEKFVGEQKVEKPKKVVAKASSKAKPAKKSSPKKKPLSKAKAPAKKKKK